MKKLIGLILVLITASGCAFTKEARFADIKDTCDRYGFIAGTDDHRDCMKETHQNVLKSIRGNVQNKNVNVKIK